MSHRWRSNRTNLNITLSTRYITYITNILKYLIIFNQHNREMILKIKNCSNLIGESPNTLNVYADNTELHVNVWYYHRLLILINDNRWKNIQIVIYKYMLQSIILLHFKMLNINIIKYHKNSARVKLIILHIHIWQLYAE